MIVDPTIELDDQFRLSNSEIDGELSNRMLTSYRIPKFSKRSQCCPSCILYARRVLSHLSGAFCVLTHPLTLNPSRRKSIHRIAFFAAQAPKGRGTCLVFLLGDVSSSFAVRITCACTVVCMGGHTSRVSLFLLGADVSPPAQRTCACTVHFRLFSRTWFA